MDQGERLIAVAAVNAEMAHVGRDNFGRRIHFREAHDAAIGDVHFRPILRDRSADGTRFVDQDRSKQHLAERGHGEY